MNATKSAAVLKWILVLVMQIRTGGQDQPGVLAVISDAIVICAKLAAVIYTRTVAVVVLGKAEAHVGVSWVVCLVMLLVSAMVVAYPLFGMTALRVMSASFFSLYG